MKNLKDTLTMRGEFCLEVKDQQGNVVESYRKNNLIVSTGRQNIARLLGSEATNRHISKIGFGTNGTAPADNDTALTSAFIKGISSVTYPTATSVQYNWTLGGSEANGLAIREFGLITASDVLFARLTRDVITKQDGFTISGTWTLFF